MKKALLSQPTLGIASQAMIDEFCDTLWLEDGLAPATLESYRRDLQQFGEWMQATHGKQITDTVHADLLAYLAHRYAIGARASSSARCLSSLRRFFQYASRQGKIAVDPTLNFEAPKRTRALPWVGHCVLSGQRVSSSTAWNSTSTSSARLMVSPKPTV